MKKEARDEDDRTALHIAAKLGDTDMFTTLINNGVEKVARGENGLQHSWPESS
jgi:ankyrin repeat protein